MRISDWSSDVCSSDLRTRRRRAGTIAKERGRHLAAIDRHQVEFGTKAAHRDQRPLAARPVDRHAGDALERFGEVGVREFADVFGGDRVHDALRLTLRSEEHTSELQSLMRISYAVFCLKKKKNERESV